MAYHLQFAQPKAARDEHQLERFSYHLKMDGGWAFASVWEDNGLLIDYKTCEKIAFNGQRF